MIRVVVVVLVLVLVHCGSAGATGCPWGEGGAEEGAELASLQANCLCASSPERGLSVQCSQVNASLLLHTLRLRAAGGRPLVLDLLHLANSSLPELPPKAFAPMHITSLQLSNCRIQKISSEAFLGLESSLRNLNLQQNPLGAVPSAALRPLRNLALLDLSACALGRLESATTFRGLPLATLKMADNANLTLGVASLAPLAPTLKNLNLKGCRLSRLPRAVANLSSLAFLDLAQNLIRDVPQDAFQGLHALTALNLERNLLQQLQPEAFRHVNDTLSSLSLLNNLLTEFPTEALSVLPELRVLDIGFNLIPELEEKSFRALSALTLLAVDGNPLASVPEAALAHLNGSLRGLSLGGRFLVCDCRLRWLTEWIRDLDLQVTSRERNPQFCGSPPEFRARSFYQLNPKELTCANRTETRVVTETSIRVSVKDSTSTSTSTTTTSTTTTPSSSPSSSPGPRPLPPPRPAPPLPPRPPPRPSTSPWPNLVLGSHHHHQGQNQGHHPNLLPPHQMPPAAPELTVKEAYRQDGAVVIQWTSRAINLLGFRVLYRLFGDASFKMGPPLAATEREFKIRNVPSQECVVVCVVLLEDSDVTPDTVSPSQCREIRTSGASSSNMDRVTIAASAAICATVIVAVVIFIATTRRRSKDKASKISSTLAGAHTLGIGAPPLASLGTLNPSKDWDQLSAISGRSIPRAKVYHLDRIGSSMTSGYIADDARSHISQMSTRTTATNSARNPSRSTAMALQGNSSGGGISKPTTPAPPASRPGSVASLWQEALLNKEVGYLRENELVQL